MRRNCSQWDLWGLGDGEPLQWLTLVSQSDGKRSWDTEEEDGTLGREEVGSSCFFSGRLSGPAWDGSPVAMTNLTFCNSSLPSSRWIIHSSGSPKWALTLWKISLRSKICVCLRDPDVGWADTWELGWSSFRGRAGPSLQSPPDFSRVSSSSCLSVVPFGSRPSRTPLQAFSCGLPLNSSPPESFLVYDPISNISPTQNSLIYASFP